MLTYIATSPCSFDPYLELYVHSHLHSYVHCMRVYTYVGILQRFSFEIMIFTAVMTGCSINYASYTHMITHTSVATTLLIGTVREVIQYTRHIASCVYMSHFSQALEIAIIISLHFSSPCSYNLLNKGLSN